MYKTSLIFSLTLALCGSFNAMAELNDPPYFNLWNTGVSAGSNMELGHGTIKSVCGTDTCVEQGQFETGASADLGAGIFMVVDPNSGKGSGAIDPFLRFQHNVGAQGNNTTEQAFSTDYEQNPNPKAGWIRQEDGSNTANQAKDSIAGGQNPEDFNHVLLLDDLLATMDGDGYFHFLLDINEPVSSAGTATLRLDELAFFVDDAPDLNFLIDDIQGEDPGQYATTSLCADNGLNGNNVGPDTSNCADKVWDMDYDDVLGGLNLNNLNATPQGGGGGSGDYDVELKLHSSLFLDDMGQKKGDYVYLYNFMGEADELSQNEADAGFEEWAYLQSEPSTSVPEPSIAWLLAAGIPAVIRTNRRKKWLHLLSMKY